MTALRNADKAGDVEAARRLAQIAQSLKAGGETPAPEGQPDTSFTSAFASGIDSPLENLGTTAETLGFKKTGAFLRNLTAAPKNYESASADFTNKGGEGFNWNSLLNRAGFPGGSIS
ncbi:hypothetical protein [Azospirillum doebereinerae]